MNLIKNIFQNHITSSLSRLLFLIGIIVAISAITPNQGYAQKRKKTQLEKKNAAKNKANRSKKRKGDKARSGSRSQRNTKFKIPSKKNEKAYRGDITGRRLVTKTSPRRSRAAKANASPYAGRGRQGEGSRFKARRSKVRYSSRASERTGFRRGNNAANNTFRISFVGKKSYKKASSTTRSASRPAERNIKKRRIVPRSSSGAYLTRRKKGPYNIFRKRSSWEKAHRGDILGRSLRTRRTNSRPTIKSPKKVRFSGGQGRKGDRSYSGKAGGSHVSASKTSEKPWKNSVSGYKIKNKKSKRAKYNSPQFQTFRRKSKVGDTPFKGKSPSNGYKSASRKGEVGGKKKLPRKGPRTKQGFNFRGNIKGSKPLKGAGGSISGRKWNNKGKPLQTGASARQDNKIYKFQGSIKGRRPAKGGGSISGKRWNNNGKPLRTGASSRQDNRIYKFQGSIKGRRPAKGGGSISGKRWNNNGKPLQNEGPNRQDSRIAKYQGGLKGYRKKPLKGGGSISGRRWNNDGKSVTKEKLNLQDFGIAKYRGKTKGRRKPIKKAGSISVLPWNNDEKPVTKEKLTPEDFRIAKNRGKIKQKKYVLNPSSGKDANKVIAKGKNHDKSASFQGRIKRTWKYKQNPSSGDESLKNLPPTGTTSKAYKFQGRFKLTSTYRKKPYAGKDALKGIGPSRATVKASNYQGNIKMSRKRLEDRHPSFKYASGKKTSVQEKDKFFSFKLLWAKWFKKNEDQPDNLKEKNRRPRFDKKEKDLWYD